MLPKKPINIVPFLYHLLPVFSLTLSRIPLCVSAAIFRLYFRAPHIWIDPWIDVNRHAPAVIGELIRTGDCAVVECRAVIVRHGTLIVSVIVVDQAHLLYRIPRLKQFAENLRHLIGAAV